MKKKIIIVSHNMDLGGVEKSLLGLLQSFDYDKYDVDLFLFSHSGELMKFIPEQVNILPEIKYYTYINKGIVECIKNGFAGIVISKLLAHYKYKKFISKNDFAINDVPLNYLYAYSNKYAPVISDYEYDLAISFSDVHYAAISKIKAKKKACWIHTDYSVTHQDVNFCKSMWNSYDYIVAVSSECKRTFALSYPDLADKVIVIENLLSKDYIEAEANAFNVNLDDDCIKILSIGRFSTPKNFNNVPNILSKIRKKGINAKWYLIGFGEQEEKIRKNIESNKMEDYVIILGKQGNPYPYIKACDVYIQPSVYEGKSVTVREAQIMNKPVIITNYPTAESQLTDGYDGIVVPLENEACATGIYNALLNKERLDLIAKNTKDVDYTNKSELKKIYDLI